MRRRPARAVVLFVDATILRWFPPLRAAWALQGTQAVVPISGQNAKRVLFGALNPRTGHRLVLRRPRMRQEDCQAFFHYLRQRYPGRPLWVLLDRAPGQAAARSQAMAAGLGLELIWLPKHCPQLNPMDHLWRPVKGQISANRQYRTVDAHAAQAARWVLSLSNREALRKAGVLSKNFWLPT